MATPADDEVDHYAVLGLPSGTSSASIPPKDIDRAYKLKARELHPDKRRDDPNATASFQALISSYEILKDADARKAFDSLLRAREERRLRESRLDSKRRRLAEDLERREKEGEVEDGEERVRKEEREAKERLKKELERVRERVRRRKGGIFGGGDEKEERKGRESGVGGVELDKDLILKVSWDKEGGDYGAERLRELFGRFGVVEDVVIRSKGAKKKGSALVVMGSRDAVVAATQNMCGNLSNPLLVLPFLPLNVDISSKEPVMSTEQDPPHLSNIVGAGYQAYEDSVLKKLQKAAEKQK